MSDFADFIDFIVRYWKSILFIGAGVAFWASVILQQRAENKRIYLAQRNEDVSKISEGVTGGMLAVFTNEEFLQALRNGAYIKIDINVDGSQNIVIAGSQNQILRD